MFLYFTNISRNSSLVTGLRVQYPYCFFFLLSLEMLSGFLEGLMLWAGVRSLLRTSHFSLASSSCPDSTFCGPKDRFVLAKEVF